MRRFAVILAFAWLALFFSFPVYAGEPMEKLKSDVNKVLDVLKDPSRRAELAKDIKNDRILPIYADMFDDVELSKRALARNWNKLSVPQRQEFVKLFRQMLEKTYGDKIMSYTDEKVVFDREIMLS